MYITMRLKSYTMFALAALAALPLCAEEAAQEAPA